MPAMQPESLDALALRSKEGDHQAFEDLVHASREELRRFLASRTHHRQLVDEVVHNTYVAVWETLHHYEPRGSLLPWIKGFGLRLLRKELARRRAVVGSETLERLLIDADLAHADSEQDELHLGALNRCMQRLDERAKELIFLRYREGLPLSAIAQRQGKPSALIATAIHRIRKALRICIERGGRP
jgi:RNA polymerase sigma-70 factor, ECF subfamily